MRPVRPVPVVLAAAALGLSACGGQVGENAQNRVEEEAQKGIDRAVGSAKREGRDRALRQIDRWERQAKRELKTNGSRRIEQAADRAREEVRRRVR